MPWTSSTLTTVKKETLDSAVEPRRTLRNNSKKLEALSLEVKAGLVIVNKVCMRLGQIIIASKN